MKDKVIGLGKPKGVSKSPWECRVWKRGPKGPKKVNGLRMPNVKIGRAHV